MRQINLIGGFYRDEPWAAEDTVNWLPVRSQSDGTRSPVKLRGLPGLVAINATVPPPPRWLLKIGAYNDRPDLAQGIFSSPDGIEWTSESPVAGGGALEFASPGYDGTILLSSNGQAERTYSGDEGQTFGALNTGGPALSTGGGSSVRVNGGWYRNGGGQFPSFSSDNGGTFTVVSSDPLSRNVFGRIAVTAGGRIVTVVANEGAAISDDGGVTWSQRTLLSAGTPTGFTVTFLSRATGTVFAACTAAGDIPDPNTSRLAYSRNNGETWTESPYRFPTQSGQFSEILGICEFGAGNIAAVNQAGEVAISTNDGTTFATSTGLTFPTVARGISGDNEKLLVCGNGGELWVTYDGASWQQLPTAYGPADILWVTQVP